MSSHCQIYTSCTYFASPEAGSPSYLIIITPSKLHSTNTPGTHPEAVSLHRSRCSELRSPCSARSRPISPLIATSRSSRCFVLRGRGKRRAYRRRTDANRPAIGPPFVQEISRVRAIADRSSRSAGNPPARCEERNPLTSI